MLDPGATTPIFRFLLVIDVTPHLHPVSNDRRFRE